MINDYKWHKISVDKKILTLPTLGIEEGRMSKHRTINFYFLEIRLLINVVKSELLLPTNNTIR